MTKLKLIPILLFVTLFSYLLSLPSSNTTMNQSELDGQLQALDDFDFVNYGIQSQKSEELDQAISLFAIGAQLEHLSEAARQHSKLALTTLESEALTLPRLRSIGNNQQLKQNSWDTNQSQNLEQFFNKKNIHKLSEELLFDKNKFNDFLVILNNAQSIVEIMPKSKLAFDVLKIAESTQILTDQLKTEITNSIKAYNKSEEINPALLEEVLNKVIPTLQLMKKCKTWYDFSLLMHQVKTARHVSILLQLANSSENAVSNLTNLLVTAHSDSTLQAAILGYINDRGISGLQNLTKALRKGPQALQMAIASPAQLISNLTPQSTKKEDVIKKWWSTISKKSPLVMEAVRYLLMTLSIFGVVLFGVQSQHLSRVLLVKDPENASVAKTMSQLFIVIFTIFAISFIFNILIGGPGQTAVNPGIGGGSLQSQGTPSTQSHNVLSGMSILSLVIIIFMQFTVYAKALSELKKIKELIGTSSLKLKQLKHADIFFDLPIYLGLLGTVSSFIIMLFDPSASRIVAYTSTIIGIIFSASLRIFYVFPLQKDLTNESEKSSSTMVN